MPLAAAEWIESLWWVIPLVVVGGFLIIFVLAGLIEQQPVDSFVRVGANEAIAPLPYAEVMNGQARVLGFINREDARHVKGGRYRVAASAWFDADRNVLLFIGSGKIAGLTTRRTFLYSRIDERRYLMTCDEFGEGDPSRTCDIDILANADLPELLQRHRQRLAKLGHQPLPFIQSSPLDAFAEMERNRVATMVQRGWFKYINPAQTRVRYSPIGVLHLIRRTFNPGTVKLRTNLGRANLPRPGDKRYTGPRVPIAGLAQPTHADLSAVDAFEDWQGDGAEQGALVSLELRSPHVSIFDPLLLDSLRGEEIARPAPADSLAATARRLGQREPAFAYVTLHSFQPGKFAFHPAALRKILASRSTDSAETVMVDSGALIVADVTALPALVSVLNWETYDLILQAPAGDNTLLQQIVQRIGGPYFAIVGAAEGTPFDGDGLYRVPASALQPA